MKKYINIYIHDITINNQYIEMHGKPPDIC